MLKAIIGGLLLGCVQVHAQPAEQKNVFYKGRQFEKVVTGVSTTTMRRGKQLLELTINSQLTKLFTVNAITDTGYKFDVTVTRMQNKMETCGKEMQFDSDQPTTDSASLLPVNNRIIKKPSIVFTNNNGVITDVYDTISSPPVAVSKNSLRNTLVNYVANPQNVAIGENFELFSNFAVNALKKEDSWIDSSINEQDTEITKYSVADITGNYVTVLFSGNITRTDSSNEDGIEQKNRVEGTINGEIKISAPTGIVASKTSHYQMHGLTNIMGIRLVTSVKNTITEAIAGL